MTSEAETSPAELRAKAQIDFLTEQIERDTARKLQLQSALDDMRVARKAENRPDLLEKDLEALDWKKASSGKCDYCRNVPLGLIEKVRTRKGGVETEFHRFTASNDEPTLFRFDRGPKK